MSEECEDLLRDIRAQNLAVYRASPVRVREDVTQEDQIAGDYRGRLVYELLQNADDAMLGAGSLDDRILFRLTDTDLFVANSGRPLTEADVVGLCGTGAGTKADQTGNRRASIGHKGMGFKSVLEVTDAPEVHSQRYAFCMDRTQASQAVSETLTAIGQPVPGRIPVMRFPWPVDPGDPEWQAAQGLRHNVLFRFPLHTGVTPDRRRRLASRMLDLPITTILFLKHLERVDVEVEADGRHDRISWSVVRERRVDSSWQVCSGLQTSGVYRIHIRCTQPGTQEVVATFLVAHDADVPIGRHRAGLVGYAWQGIEFTEVSVATPWPTGTADELPGGWARFHVFLPTGEPSPYPLVVNGAFATDLSRQEIRVSTDPDDYNRFLLERAAVVFRDQLVDTLLRGGGRSLDVLRMLDRERVHQQSAIGDELHSAMKSQLAGLPFIETEEGERVSISGCAVPPVSPKQSLGSELRSLLPRVSVLDGYGLPAARLCASDAAHVLADLGARQLSPIEAVDLLAQADADQSHAVPGATGSIQVDPVLGVLEGLLGTPGGQHPNFARTVRASPLFPVAIDTDGRVTRIRTNAVTCFYPPRSLGQRVPLDGLAFMARALCWGDLIPKDRNELLRDHMLAWQALFDIREFKFPDVMRASVLPSLDLPSGDEAPEARRVLEDIDRLAAICQLSGRTPNPSAPLPYERLGPNRALFNLSRLPVPCVGVGGDGIRWLPAYLAYFGRSWTGEASIEGLVEELRQSSPETAPDIPILVDPSHLAGSLTRYEALARAADGADDDTDEVDHTEDEEAALDTDERARWFKFLSWIGVNRVLRPVSFHDVEDRGSGWLSTAGLKQPDGHAFRELGKTWTSWREQVQAAIGKLHGQAGTWYLYEAHDLEFAGVIPLVARNHVQVARALYEHLARNWDVLASFQTARGALVPADRQPSMRSRPQKPYSDEERDLGDDLWLYRLRRVSWVPTSHGPRLPSKAWLPSTEIARRFGRRGSHAADLIPIISADRSVLEGRARGLAQALRIREDFGPSTFRDGDAKALLDRLEFLYSGPASAGEITDETLRQVVRPAYRNLIELLSGRLGDDDDAAATAGAVDATLGDAKVLVHDGNGNMRFVPARTAYYMARSGTRERLDAGEPIWTLVNEASLTARKPLRLLGIRVLEDELHWDVQPGGPAFEDDAELVRFRVGIRALAPFILARLRADRPDERLALLDGGRLRRLLAALDPVRSLTLSCSLDGRVVSRGVARDGFVEFAEDRGVRAYVRWGERGWPPSATEAEALAGVFVDTFGAGAFEAFLALVRAESDASRYRLLSLAGAPLDLDEVWESGTAVIEDRPSDDTADAPATQATVEGTAEAEATDGAIGGSPAGEPPIGRTSLYKPEDLEIAGLPIVIAGTGRSPARRSGRARTPDFGTRRRRALGGVRRTDGSHRTGSPRDARGDEFRAAAVTPRQSTWRANVERGHRAKRRHPSLRCVHGRHVGASLGAVSRIPGRVPLSGGPRRPPLVPGF